MLRRSFLRCAEERNSGCALRIFGHLVSQPTRSVVWALRIKKVPHEFIVVRPLAGDCNTDSYLSFFPCGTVPAMEHDVGVSETNEIDQLRITEAPAILAYLADEFRWSDWYPQRLSERARINQWMSWHLENTRKGTVYLMRPLSRVELGDKHWAGPLPKEDLPAHFKQGYDALDVACRVLTYGAFKPNNDHGKGPFLLGDVPSIADLLLYSEFDQLYVGDIWSAEAVGYPLVQRWVEAMRTLPLHDDVRTEMVAAMNTFGKHKPEKFSDS